MVNVSSMLECVLWMAPSEPTFAYFKHTLTHTSGRDQSNCIGWFWKKKNKNSTTWSLQSWLERNYWNSNHSIHKPRSTKLQTELYQPPRSISIASVVSWPSEATTCIIRFCNEFLRLPASSTKCYQGSQADCGNTHQMISGVKDSITSII